MFDTPLPTLTFPPVLGFTRGTRVHTNEGLKPIDSFRAGDWVLTHLQPEPPPRRRRHPFEYSYKRVKRITTVEAPSLVRIALRNLSDGIEDILFVAADQPIWTQPMGWLAASQVRNGQAVVLSFNGNAIVHSTEIPHQHGLVYQLELEEGNGYYVEQLGTWVSCDPDAVAQNVAPTEPLPTFDVTSEMPQQIEDYYDDTLAPPEAPTTLMPELAEQMRESAEKLRSIFKEKMELDLDYDAASIRWLAGYIDRNRLHCSDIEEQSTKGQIQIIGAFLGEYAIRSIGGHWSIYDGMFCVVLDGGNIVFPHNKVTKQFMHGSEGGDSINGFVETNKRLQEAMGRKPLTPAQERLLEYLRNPNHRIFVPSTSSDPPGWVQVAAVDGPWMQLLAPPNQGYTTSLDLASIRCFYVLSSSGHLLHTEWIQKLDWDTLPPEVLRQIKGRLSTDTSLTLSQLEHGNRFVEVSYGASNKQADDCHYYSTTLKNISSHGIQITRFGGFKAHETAWQLASVTGDFYTANLFREWYDQKTQWLLPGETLSDIANWGHPPVLWAYYGVTDTGESFVAGKVLEKPFATPGSGSGAHFVKSLPPQPEMAHIIDKLRTSYALRQLRMNDITLASLTGSRPLWLSDSDGLAEIFAQQTLLLTKGHVVWGALVQANSLLFRPGDDDCPALLVHSPDSYFDSRPQELRLIGHTFFSFKHTEPTDPELKEVARLVTDEMNRSMGFELPMVFSSKSVRSATFMVFRKHVPMGVLSSGIFPILTHPSTQAVMMVPFEFWPIELIMLWKENAI